MKLWPHQEKALAMVAAEFRKGHKAVTIVVPTGGGKCLGIGTPVMRFDGTISSVEDIRAGDALMGPDSLPRNVLSTTRGRGPLYRIVPKKGTTWVCNDVHVLTLVHTVTGEIVDIDLQTYLTKSKSWRHAHKMFTPDGGVEFEPSETPEIDPYFIGVWFGDGTKRDGVVSISKPDPEIREVVERTAAEWGLGVRIDQSGSCPTYHIVGARGKGNPLLQAMRRMIPNRLSVPAAIRVGSRETRRAFLAGVIDTDGYVTENGSVEITQKHEGIAEGIQFVARSLGIRATCRSKVVGGRAYHRMFLSGDFSEIPVAINRKRPPERKQKKSVTRTGFEVESIGEGEYAGFQLDGDGRFLLGDFTVTHNTIIATAIAIRHLAKKPDGQVLFTAHREELVSQAYDALTEGGLSCGVIQAVPSRPCNPHRPVQVASVQTMLARKLTPHASLVIFDEQHHYASDKWQELALEYRRRGVPIIGLTATPVRADGRGFEGLMDALVCPVSMRELIEQGFLTPYTLVAPERRLRSDQIAARPVDAYLQHASGRKSIVFAGTVKAANEYRDQFRTVGITCETVWGDMEPGARRAVLEDYKAGRIQVLTNVGVLTEGFDDRPTSCAILARSVGSLSLYLQICGRALRVSPETGKKDAVIIDLHGSCRDPEFGEPAQDREWVLEGDGIKHKKLEQPTEKFCLVCKVLLEPGAATVCELCGIARPEALPPEVVNAKLVKYAAKLRETPEQRRAYFEKLKAIARENQYSVWQPRMKYKALYGAPPPRDWW